jgi:hypothetical protein
MKMVTNKVIRNKDKNPFFIDYKVFDKTDNVIMKGQGSPMKDFEKMFKDIKKKIR